MSIKFLSQISIDSVKEFIEDRLTQIVYFALLLLMIVFFSIFLINKRENKTKELMLDYYRAIYFAKENQEENAIIILEKIYSSNYSDENLKTISGIRIVDLYIKQEKLDEAKDILKKIYSFKKSDLFFRNLSGISLLNIMINENNPENYNEIDKLILSLKNPKNPLLLLTYEQEAMFELQKGNTEIGLTILNDIKNNNSDTIDEDMSKRIETIISLYKNENL